MSRKMQPLPEKFRSFAVTLAMLVLALSTLRLAASGKLLLYIHPATSWWVALGGAVLLLLALLWLRLKPDHIHVTTKQLAGLLVVAVVVAFSPNVPLSAELAPKREGGVGAVVRSTSGIRPGAVTQEFTILEWLVAWEGDPTHQRYLGSGVKLSGFVTREEGKVYVNRYLLTCCAVDAQVLRMQVATQADLPDGWVEVVGTMGRQGDLPVVSVTGFKQIDEPAKPYLY